MKPDGFPTADVDVGLLADDRVLDAVERSGSRTLVAYLAVLTTSWARGERVQLATAIRRTSAIYRLEEVLDELLATLVDVGLLDADGRIPATTWASWYGAAAGRRQLRREAGRRGGMAKAARRASSSDARGPGRTNGASSASDARALPGEDASEALATLYPTDRPSVATDVATDGPSVAIYCLDYLGHQLQHRRAYAGGPFVCPVCGAPPGPSFDERMAQAGAHR